MTFVHGTALTNAVRAVIGESDCDLAVAFFGKGAADRLGIGRKRRVRIVCDLWSGACNPYELERLAERGAELKNARGLHAKVYLGANAAIVTSANASINGLGEEGQQLDVGLEAGVLLKDPAELKNIREWFKSVYDRAADVNPAELDELKAWWDTARHSSRRVPSAKAKAGLLTLAVASPNSLPGIGFVFTDTVNDARAVASAREVASASTPDRAREIADWSQHNMFTGWEAAVVRKWPGQFIAYHRGARNKLWVRAMRMDLRFPSEGALFCTPDWRGIVAPLLPSLSSRDAERHDAAIADEIINEMGEGMVFTSATELAAQFAT